MAHFAQIDENNKVIKVVVIDNKNLLDYNGVEVEEIGVEFCKNLFGEGTTWKQTSYNNNFRYRYASIGYTYDPELDAFIPPKPFPSWIFNYETLDWESPIGPPPKNSTFYIWDEENKSWLPN